MVAMTQLKPQKFKAGTIIFREGDGAGPAYLVKSGRAQVIIGSGKDETNVATIGENGIFGEMSLVDNSPRSATIKAIEDMECIVINRHKFEAIFEDAHPCARTLFEVQCYRLRKMTQQMKYTDSIQ